MDRLPKLLLVLLIVAALFLGPLASVSFAKTSIPAGIHILNPEEIDQAAALTDVRDAETWRYVTIPFTLADTQHPEKWQKFFDTARELHIIPLVRLTTQFEGDAWVVPTKKDVVDIIAVLSSLEWPTDQRHIIVFNEVNHAKEWGGSVDPEGYADIFAFTARWAHTEGKDYIVLPAALDLAAPNGVATMEAFNYLSKMHAVDEDVFLHADAWNSHSYPNPGFSSSPTRVGKNSMRGFKVELEWLKEKTDRDFLVYITETGWEVSPYLSQWMPNYYEYAVQHIWSDPAVIAVTPFILQGSPGPFEDFSFLDAQGKPTQQYISYRSALSKQFSESDLITAKIDVIE